MVRGSETADAVACTTCPTSVADKEATWVVCCGAGGGPMTPQPVSVAKTNPAVKIRRDLGMRFTSLTPSTVRLFNTFQRFLHPRSTEPVNRSDSDRIEAYILPEEPSPNHTFVGLLARLP